MTWHYQIAHRVLPGGDHWYADVTGLHGYCTELIALFPAAAPSCGHHYEPRGLPNLPPLEDSACSSDS